MEAAAAFAASNMSDERAALEALLFDDHGQPLHDLALKTALHRGLAAVVGMDDTAAAFAKHSQGQRTRSVCGALWKRGSIAYRCLDCEVDPTSAICAECFHGGVHAGHDYRIVHTSSGCCDCGEPTAWKASGFCKHHGVETDANGKRLFQPRLPAALMASLATLLDVICARLQVEVEAAMVVGLPTPAAKLSVGTEQLFRGAQQGSIRDIDKGLKNNADVNAKDGSQFQTTALHWAAQGGHVPIVKKLLAAGASVTAVNAYRQTALQCAVFEGNIKVTELLLSANADPTHQDLVRRVGPEPVCVVEPVRVAEPVCASRTTCEDLAVVASFTHACCTVHRSPVLVVPCTWARCLARHSRWRSARSHATSASCSSCCAQPTGRRPRRARTPPPLPPPPPPPSLPPPPPAPPAPVAASFR